MTAGEAFLLLFSGTLGIYCELAWPGRVVPGLAGSLLAVTGINALAHMRLSAAGIAMIGLAAALFLMQAFWAEASWPVLVVAGIGCTLALTLGAALLVRGPGHVPLVLAVPACVSFSALTLFLCEKIRRARRNKWLDPTQEQVRPV